MTNERAKMLYYEQLYKLEKHRKEKHETESETKIAHLQGWIGILIGTNLATAFPIVLWAVM